MSVTNGSVVLLRRGEQPAPWPSHHVSLRPPSLSVETGTVLARAAASMAVRWGKARASIVGPEDLGSLLFDQRYAERRSLIGRIADTTPGED